MNQIVQKTWLGALLVVAGISVTACAPQYIPNPPTGFETKPISLAHKVYYTPGNATLSPSESKRLNDFIDQNQSLRGSPVTLQLPGGMQRTPEKSVVKTLSGAGFTDITRMAATSPDPGIVVTINSRTALPRSCVSGDAMSGGMTTPGCINDMNLASMVANPADLTRGRTMGPSLGERVVAPISSEDEGAATTDLNATPSFGF